MMQKFEPFYIYTQALDNLSQDLMYKITQDSKVNIEQITVLSVTQDIMQNIYGVMNDKNLKHDICNYILKKLPIESKEILPKIYMKHNQVVLEVKSNDKDNHGRHAPILVFLTLPNTPTHQENEAYADYFSQGFIQFCQITGRNPKLDIDQVIELMLSGLNTLHENKPEGSSLQIPKFILIGVICLIILFILKKCIA